MRTIRKRERGIALILVIWVVTLLLVIAGSFLYAMRTDAMAARNGARIARGDALAQAAISRTLFELFKPQGGPEVWKREAAARSWSFDGATVAVRFADESGKIDINTANNELLKGLLRSAGLGDEDVAKLVDAIHDWRDRDSLRRPNGAEEQDYAQAGLPGRPANFPFQSTEELQLVLGMRPEVYQRIAPMITVYSRHAGVNPHLAQRAVLLAIPAVTEEQVDAYLAEREAARLERRIPPIFVAAGSYATYAQGATVSVRADVTLEEGISVSREAVAMLTPQFVRRPYTFLAWREVAPEKSPTPPAPATEVPVGR